VSLNVGATEGEGTEGVQTVEAGPTLSGFVGSTLKCVSHGYIRMFEYGKKMAVSCLEVPKTEGCTLDVPNGMYALAQLPFAFVLHPSLLSIDRPDIDQSSWPSDASCRLFYWPLPTVPRQLAMSVLTVPSLSASR